MDSGRLKEADRLTEVKTIEKPSLRLAVENAGRLIGLAVYWGIDRIVLDIA